jgi:TonB family protein
MMRDPVKPRLASAVAVVACALVACRGSASQGDAQSGAAAPPPTPPPESEAPVALNPNVPIAYPPALYDQKVEGDVTLRLFVDSTGKLIPESTRVAEGSGYPALDSAALAGARALRFAPAKRHGIPVATAFLQPVEFRQVGTTRTGTGTVTLPPAPPPPPPPAARPRPRPVVPTPKPPPPPPVDTTRTGGDTTKARPDSGAATH